MRSAAVTKKPAGTLTKPAIGRPKLAETKARVNVCLSPRILKLAAAESAAADMSLSGFIAGILAKHLKVKKSAARF